MILRHLALAFLLSRSGSHPVHIARLEPLSFASGSRSVGCDHYNAERIRRVVRRHMNEIKHCYELQLHWNHALAGRVVVRFVVNPNGTVGAAAIASSTLGNQTVEACMRAAVRRWRFPALPDLGGELVSYPFVLTPVPPTD